MTIVLGRLYAYIVQRGRITEIVLRRVGVGMKHIWCGEYLKKKGVEPELTYLFMHGHTLMDNVVMILLHDVCEKLRQMSLAKIVASSKEGVALNNEMSNYKNTLRSIRDVLLDNDNYTSCPLYKRLEADIQRYIETTVAALQLQDK